jgi:hypothetical protein
MAEGVISRIRRFSGLDKAQMEHAENVVSVESIAASDAVLVGGERVEVTEEDVSDTKLVNIRNCN